jgi:hypothetical protein
MLGSMLARVVTLVVAQGFDLATFLAMVGVHGPHTEANPVVAAVLVDQGLEVVALAKVAVTLLVVSAVLVLASTTGRGGRVLATTVAIVEIVAGLVGGLSNTSVLAA